MKKTLMVLGLMLGLTLGNFHAWAQNMKTYYPNGKVQMEITDSAQKMFYEDGKLQMETPLKDGNPAGTGKAYYPDGKLMREDDYDKKHWKQYDPSGHLLAEGDM